MFTNQNFSSDAPVISKVGPSVQIDAVVGEKITLTCVAAGSPQPNYQWLQQEPTGKVKVLGYEPNLVIENINYDHQGQFVCKASNVVGKEKREIQSQTIEVSVKGKPQISYSTKSEFVFKTGEDATVGVEFCANPRPKQTWDIGPVAPDGRRVELGSGSRRGRFVVDHLQESEKKKDCYVASLRILGVHSSDARSYPLQLINDHGIEEFQVKMVVIDTTVSQEIFIAIVVGGTITILIFSLLIIYLVKADKCCRAAEKKVPEGDKTDIESCHSSTVSGNTDKTVIPPDALYGTAEKKRLPGPFPDHLFNDSHEKLRPDLLSAATSRSGSPNQGFDSKATYNDLCFPKASNCGSMKRKKQRNQGVECQLNINTYGYINYLNNETDIIAAKTKLNSVDNRLYE